MRYMDTIIIIGLRSLCTNDCDKAYQKVAMKEFEIYKSSKLQLRSKLALIVIWCSKKVLTPNISIAWTTYVH